MRASRVAIGVVLIGAVVGVVGPVEGREQLAYIWHRGDRYGLSLVTVGGREELLLEGSRRFAAPTWTPQGEALIFSREVSSGQSQLFRLDLADRHLQPLTEGPAEANYPRVSPDGRWLVFQTYREGGSKLFVMPTVGGAPHLFATAPAEARAGEWIPGTSFYAYLGEIDGIVQVWLADAASDAVRQLTTSQQAKAGIMPSPDGRFIAVHMLFIDVATGAEHPWYPSPQQVRLPGIVAELATWNPQGTAVVFVSNVDEKSYEVYRMAPDGTGIRNLTRHPAFDSFPAWSPDGASIAFTSGRCGGGRYEVYVMNPNGSHVRRVTHGLDFQFSRPAWRPLTSERVAGTDPRRPVR